MKKKYYLSECGNLDVETQIPTYRYNQHFSVHIFYMVEMTLCRKIIFFYYLTLSLS